MSNDIEGKIKDKLTALGATPTDLNTMFIGNTFQAKMNSLNVYLGAKAPDNEKIATLRSFAAKGTPDEVLSRITQAGTALKKYVFNK